MKICLDNPQIEHKNFPWIQKYNKIHTYCCTKHVKFFNYEDIVRTTHKLSMKNFQKNSKVCSKICTLLPNMQNFLNKKICLANPQIEFEKH